MRVIFPSRYRRRLTEPQYTLRSGVALIGFWLAAIVIVLVAGWPLVRGNLAVASFSLPAGGLVIWLLHVTIYQPAVYYDRHRLIVVNVLRVHDIPWARVSALRPSVDLVIELDDGRRLHATGAPYPRRGLRMSTEREPRGRGAGRNFDGDVSVLDDFRSHAEPSSEPVVSAFDRLEIAIGLVLSGLLGLGALMENLMR